MKQIQHTFIFGAMAASLAPGPNSSSFAQPNPEPNAYFGETH